MKQIIRGALIVGGAVALILLLLYSLRGVIVEPRLRALLVSTVETSLGPRVFVGDISGSYLASLEIEDLRTLERGTTGPVTVVEAERIGLRYSLFSLLSGFDAFLGKLKVDLDGVRLELSLTGEGDEQPPGGEPLKPPPVLPEIAVRDSSISVEGEGYSVDAGGISLSTRRGSGKGVTFLDVGVRELRLAHPRVREETVSLGALLAYDGEGITLDKISLNGEVLVKGGSMDLTGLPRVVEAQVETLLFSRRLDVALIFEENLLDLKVETEEFDFGELFSVLLLPEVKVEGLLSAEAALRLDTGSLGQMEGDLSLGWEGVRMGTFSADSIEGRASAREGHLLVERLEGRSERNLVSMDRLGLSLEALLEGDWTALADSLEGGLSLHVENLAGLLSQGGIDLTEKMKEIPFHRVDLEASVGSRTVSFREGRLEAGGGLVELKPSSLALPPAGVGWGKAALHLDLLADFPDLSVLTDIFPLTTLGGTFRGEVFLDGPLDALAGRVNVSSQGLSVDGRRVEEVILEGSADSRRLTVHTGAVRVGGGAGHLEIRELSASSKDLFASQWRALLAGTRGTLTLRSTDVPALLRVLDMSVPEEDVPEHVLELEGGIGGGTVEVKKGLLETPTGQLLLERAKIVFPAPELPWSETSLEISFDADVPDLEEPGKLIGFPGLAGNLGGRLEAAGTMETLRGTASLEGSGLAYRGFHLGELSLKGSADRSRLRLDSLRITQKGALVTAAGSLDIPSGTIEGLSLALEVEDVAAFTGELTALEHRGALEATAELAGALTSLEGSFDVAFREGNVGELEIPETFVKGSLAGTRVEIAEATAETSEGSLSLSGGFEAEKEAGLYRLHLDDLTLARKGLELALDSPTEAVYSSRDGFLVDSFNLSGPPGSIRLSGGMPREGDVTLSLNISSLTGEGWLEEFVGDRFAFSGGDFAVRASGSLERPSLSLTGTVAEFLGRGAPFPLSGEIHADYSSAGIEIGAFSWVSPTGMAVDVKGILPLDPLADEPLLPAELSLAVRLDIPDLREIAFLLPEGYGVDGSLGGRLEAAGTMATLRGTASLEGSGLAYRGFHLGELSLKGSADRSRLRLDSLRITQKGALVTAAGSLDIPSGTIEGLSLALEVEDVAAFTGELTALEHRGALEATAELAGALTSLEGSFDVAFREGNVGELEIPETFVKGSLAGTRVEIAEATAETSEGSLSLSGGFEAEKEAGLYRLHLDDLTLARKGLELALDSPTEAVYSSRDGFLVDSFNLSGPPGSIRLSGGMPREGDVTLSLNISSLTGEGWLEEFVGDRFAFSGGDFAVRASGSLERPSLSLTGTVAEFLGRGAPFPLSGEIHADYSSAGIEIGAFSWVSPTGMAVDVKGILPLDPLADEPLLPAELSLAVRLDIPDLREIAFLLPEGYGVDGKLEGEADLSGTWEKPSGEARIRIVDLSFPEKLRPAPPGKLSVDCRLEAVSGELTLREMKIDSPAISANVSGSWTGVPVLVDVARGGEELLQGDVILEGTLEASELRWVSRGVDVLRSADGRLEASFSLEGPVGAPEITLEADLKDLGFRIRGVPPVGEVNGDLSLKDGTLKIPGLEGDLGGAPFELSGSLAGIGGEELDFDLKLTGDGLLLYRDEGVRVRADADLAARGPLSKLGVSGTVMITDSRYVKNIDLLGLVGGQKAPTVRRGGALFSFRAPPLRDLVFDLRLRAKDPFIVRNQFIRGTVTPNLRLTGTGEEPALEGRVTIDEYRAQLPTGVLRGEQGLVVFRKGETARPWLEVLGEGRMLGYDITAQITGFADEPRIIFSSSPPLPGDEVLLMVLAGTPPRSSDTAAAASTEAALSVFLARSFVSHWFGGDSEATVEMLLDSLEIQVGRDITEKGDPTIDVTFQLREQFLLKGGSLHLTGEKDRYDDSNYGVRFGLDFLNKEEE